jgi:riboflavin synthase alpha subunit
MFSGIVSHKSKVLKVENFSDFIRIHITTPKNFNKRLKKGGKYFSQWSMSHRKR